MFAVNILIFDRNGWLNSQYKNSKCHLIKSHHSDDAFSRYLRIFYKIYSRFDGIQMRKFIESNAMNIFN